MSKIVTDEEIARLAELDKAASPVPWGVDTDGREVCSFSDRYSGGPPHDIFSESFARSLAEHDAALIVESRNALPRLLDSVRRLKEAFDLAMGWANRSPAGHSSLQYDDDMARIRDLVGE